jgi:hypothetical protein
MSNFNYLKKFENFSDGEYYNTLTQEEFFNILNKNTIIDIDSNLKDIIESRLKHKSYVTIRTVRSGYGDFGNNRLSRTSTPKKIEVETFISVTGGSPDRTVEDLIKYQLSVIYALDDEWFLVANSTEFRGMGRNKPKDTYISYQCDQLEGLMKLLGDLDIIK